MSPAAWISPDFGFWLLGPARMNFFEEALPGVVKHPADTWTNIGPVLAGLAILYYARRPLERLLGAGALWTGVASAYFHASNTILGETLDLSGMFWFILAIAALQQYRERRTSHRWLIALVLVGTLVATVASMFSTILASPLFAVIVVAVCIRAVVDGKLGPWAWAVLATFGIAWAFWWLDFLHILGSAHNHILTGHGVWHLLNGLVFWFTFMHFRNVSANDRREMSRRPPAVQHFKEKWRLVGRRKAIAGG